MTDNYEAFFNRLRPGRFYSQWDPNHVPQEGTVGGDQIGTFGFIEDDAVDTAQIKAGAVDATKFASTIRPPQVVDTLPTLPDASYPQGSLVFYTVDSKLYRNTDGSTWSVAVDGGDIEANSILAGSIAAGAIGTDELAANIILGSLIKTADTGDRVEIDADGIRAIDSSDVLRVNIPTDGSDVYVNAEVQATALTVTGDASFQGSGSEVATGAVITLQEGISNPISGPNLSQGWDTKTFYCGSSAWPAWGAEYNSAGGSGGATAVVYIIDSATKKIIELNASTGALIRSVDVPADCSVPFNVAVHGGYVYLAGTSLSAGRAAVWRLSESTLTYDTAYTSWTQPGTATACAISSDGTYLYVVQGIAGGFAFGKFDSSMAVVASAINVTSVAALNDPYDCKAGTFDFGAWRLVVVQLGEDEAHIFDSTGAHKTDECFPIVTSGFAGGLAIYWDGSSFYSGFRSADGTSYNVAFEKHTGWTWTSATSANVWVGYTWYDSAGTTHETAVGPRTSTAMAKRKRLLVTTAGLPGGGGADEPNNRRIYAIHSSTAPATTSLDLQTTTSSASAYLSSIAAGAAPPASNDFPGGSSAQIVSAGAGISGSGVLKLNGDGSAQFVTLAAEGLQNGLNAGGGTSGYWTKIGGGSIESQYATVVVRGSLIMYADGHAGVKEADVTIRVKQQDAFPASPIVNVRTVGDFPPEDVVVVVTSSAGPTTYEIWVQAQTTYQYVFFLPTHVVPVGHDRFTAEGGNNWASAYSAGTVFTGSGMRFSTDAGWNGISVASGPLARYVPISSIITVVNAGTYTSSDGSVQTSAEITGLPSSGVVAVNANVIAAQSSVHNGNYVRILNYGQSVSNWGLLVYPGAVANIYAAGTGIVTTGGTNDRQIQYARVWGAGTVTWYLRVVGYWTTV